MDLSIILTYRCNSKCSMCFIWKNPTDPKYEIDLKTLEKLPGGFDYLNLTGGEPTLRDDLEEICDLLYPKTKTLEISTNGLKAEKLLPIVKKYSNIKIRISLEGVGLTNNEIRGEKDGYSKKIEGMKKLIEAGGCDLGFAITFQDENIEQVIDIFKFTQNLNIELATSALHNAFQFHKNDNTIYNRLRVAKKVEELITEMLKSNKPKDWFRAYLNLGLIGKILGHDRLHMCTQGTDSIFIDPWGDVYACNVRNDLNLGNIKNQSWQDIYHGTIANSIRKKVENCPQNCWMVSSAKTAIRNKHYAKFPKIKVMKWVLINKLKTLLHVSINFQQYIDYTNVLSNSGDITKRVSYLNSIEKKELQPAISCKYTQLNEYFNR